MRIAADFEIRNNYTTVMALMQIFNQEGYAVNIIPKKANQAQIVVTEPDEDEDDTEVLTQLLIKRGNNVNDK